MRTKLPIEPGYHVAQSSRVLRLTVTLFLQLASPSLIRSALGLLAESDDMEFLRILTQNREALLTH